MIRSERTLYLNEKSRWSHGSKTCLLRRGFHTLIRNVSFPSPTYVRSNNSPLGSLASSLTQRPLFGSDTICNSPSPPLIDMVSFDLLCIVVSLTVLKRVYYGEVSTLL